MGSLIININHKILTNSLNSLTKKRGAFQQCCRARHVFSYKSSNYCTLQYTQNLNLKKFLTIRLASTNVNFSETSSSVDFTKTLGLENAKPEVDVVSNVSKPEIPTDESLLVDPFSFGSDSVAAISDVSSQFIKSGLEPSLKSLGLASPYTPAGWLQSLLEFFHVNCDLPWWGSIVAVTLILRTITLPVFLYCKKHAVTMSNYTPKMQKTQIKVAEALATHNYDEADKLRKEMMQTYKKHLFKPFIPISIQAVTFLSFFCGLRGMAELPVESMKTGGLFWFTDLTLCDQYYLLPLMTSASLMLVMEFGPETTEFKETAPPNMKYVLRALPFTMLLFTIHFPSAVLVYWTTNNAFTVVQMELLRHKEVREAFGIPEKIYHKKEDLPLGQMSIGSFKKTIEAAKKAANDMGRLKEPPKERENP